MLLLSFAFTTTEPALSTQRVIEQPGELRSTAAPDRNKPMFHFPIESVTL
jgi:hypothetical protein